MIPPQCYSVIILTTDGWLISSIRAVLLTVAYFVQVYAHLVSGTQPLSRRTTKRRGGAVLFVAHVPAVIFTIAHPLWRDAHLVGTLEVVGLAGGRWAGVVFIRAVLTVWMAVTLPSARYAEPVRLALEFSVVAEAWTYGGCRGSKHTTSRLQWCSPRYQ